MKPVFDGDRLFYCVGARTAIGIEPCDPALAGERFCSNEWAFTTSACVPVRERTWIDALTAQGDQRDDRSRTAGRHLGSGYYYVLFEDPDGIRLEVNFVPGAGVLADGSQFNPTTGYI
jgi:hypothetical protein